jgi:hypothetical protein
MAVLRATIVCVVLASCACGDSNQSVAPSPTLLSIELGLIGIASDLLKVHMSATGRFSNGPRDLTQIVAWQSSHPSVAIVSANGLVAFATKTGTVTITATYQEKSASMTLVFTGGASPWDY